MIIGQYSDAPSDPESSAPSFSEPLRFSEERPYSRRDSLAASTIIVSVAGHAQAGALVERARRSGQGGSSSRCYDPRGGLHVQSRAYRLGSWPTARSARRRPAPTAGAWHVRLAALAVAAELNVADLLKEGPMSLKSSPSAPVRTLMACIACCERWPPSESSRRKATGVSRRTRSPRSCVRTYRVHSEQTVMPRAGRPGAASIAACARASRRSRKCLVPIASRGCKTTLRASWSSSRR